jgi:uncharacterized protein
VALVRVLIDGYSLLHSWPEILPGQPPHSAAARDELTRRVRRYGDAEAVPVTIVFDGSQPFAGVAMEVSTPDCEVLYSPADQTADDVIERLVHRLLAYGEVMVVTDDHAERDTVLALGGIVAGCSHFIQAVETAGKELSHRVKQRLMKSRNRPINPIRLDACRD